uniref:VP1 n=1 Tax=Chicken proventricular necrosis virus TaxID=908207 RepID=A0A876XRB7_9VIRU|nr:VP1 [Chicken proventricular necrosis virus]
MDEAREELSRSRATRNPTLRPITLNKRRRAEPEPAPTTPLSEGLTLRSDSELELAPSPTLSLAASDNLSLNPETPVSTIPTPKTVETVDATSGPSLDYNEIYVYIDNEGKGITPHDIVRMKQQGLNIEQMKAGWTSVYTRAGVPPPPGSAPQWALAECTKNEPKASYLRLELGKAGLRLVAASDYIRAPTLAQLNAPPDFIMKFVEEAGTNTLELAPMGMPGQHLSDLNYHQRARVGKPLKLIFSSCAMDIIRSKGGEKAGLQELYLDLLKTASSKVRGVAGTNAIVPRMQALEEVRQWSETNNVLMKDVAQMARRMIKVYDKVAEPKNSASFEPKRLLLDPECLETTSGERAVTIQIHPNSAAGPGFGTGKQKEAWLSAVALAQEMWEGKWHQLMKVCYAKQKDEVYEADKFGRTRIISVRCMAAEISGGALARLFYKCTRAEGWSSTSNRSLRGFNPLGPDLQSILHRTENGEKLVLHYADNLYFISRDRVVSYDASKFEASHSGNKIEAAVKAMLAVVGGGSLDSLGRVVGTTKLTDKSVRFILGPYLNSLTDSVSLRNTTQWKTPGMPSGTSLTFLINDLVMGCAVQLALESGVNLADANSTIEFMAKCGIKLKVECESDLNPSLTAFNGLGSPGRLDLLGFDLMGMRVSNQEARFLVLNEDRCMDSLVWGRSDANQEELDDLISAKGKQLSMLVSALLNGQGTYKPIEGPIRTAVRRLQEELTVEIDEAAVAGGVQSSWITSNGGPSCAVIVGMRLGVEPGSEEAWSLMREASRAPAAGIRPPDLARSQAGLRRRGRGPAGQAHQNSGAGHLQGNISIQERGGSTTPSHRRRNSKSERPADKQAQSVPAGSPGQGDTGPATARASRHRRGHTTPVGAVHKGTSIRGGEEAATRGHRGR